MIAPGSEEARELIAELRRRDARGEIGRETLYLREIGKPCCTEGHLYDILGVDRASGVLNQCFLHKDPPYLYEINDDEGPTAAINELARRLGVE